MSRAPRKTRSSDVCVVRIISTGEEGPFDARCGRPAELVVGTTPMCPQHAKALKSFEVPAAGSAAERERSTQALLEAQKNATKLPSEARAEARAGRPLDDFSPRIEVDAGWLADVCSQLETAGR